MSIRTVFVTGIVATALLGSVTTTHAQGTVIGSLRWQLQPFCNVITVTVVQLGAQYQVEGTDDLCGAPRLASVVGRAFPNPDGTIGFGLTTVTTSGAAAVHIDARISLATLGGPWSDSAGNAGTFVFTPGPGVGGNVRPIPAGGIAPGIIGSAQLAAGAVTATQLAAGAVSYLDGLYLEQAQPIVINESAGGWRTLSTSNPVTFDVLGPVLFASGTTLTVDKIVTYSLPLTGPAAVGGSQYRLSAVEYCIRTISAPNVMVTSAAIYSDGFTGTTPVRVEVTDPTDRTTAGVCPVLTVATPPQSSYALVLSVQLVGAATAGLVTVSGVRSTWVPVTP